MVIYYTYLKYILFALIAISLPIIGLVVLKIFQKLTAGRCRSLVCLNGKTAIVTGGNSGVGFETALQLASRGCRVIIADKEDSTAARDRIANRTNNKNVTYRHLDLASLQSVRRFAKAITATEEGLHILVNNAAVGTVGHNKHTDDGLHTTMQINHFGPFLLTHLLADLLKKSAPSRIVFVSSATAFFSYNLSVDNLNFQRDQPIGLLTASAIYGNSKLCNVIVANGFAERLRQFGVTSNSLHPGLVHTGIHLVTGRYLRIPTLASLFQNTLVWLYGKTPSEGAQTTVDLAVSNRWKEVSGRHFWDCRMFLSPPKSWNRTFCQQIWERSEELVRLRPEERLM